MVDEGLWDDVHPVPPRPVVQASPGMLLADRYELDLLIANWPQTDADGHPLPGGKLITSWQATDKTLSRSVLMHLMAPDDPRTPQTLNAARQAAVSNDARFLRVLDAMDSSAQDPFCFVVSELPPGKSLRALLNQADGGLGNAEAAFVIQQLCDALAPMHEQGKFHLCLRPESVMISDVGDVKILGFLVEAAVRDLPTRKLALEEQRRLDMHRVGALLYACLTGYWPVPLDQPQRVTYGLAPAPLQGLPGAQTRIAPHALNAKVHPSLSSIAMKLLAADDENAQVSAAATSSALLRLLGNSEPQDALAARVSGRDIAPASDELSQADQPTAVLAAVEDTVDLETTQTMAVTSMIAADDGDEEPAVDDDQDTEQQAATPLQRSSAEPVKASPSQAQLDRRAKQRRQRTLIGLIAFILISLLILQMNSCRTGTSGERPEKSRKPAASATVAQQLQIAAATDFDPRADGGEEDENKQLVPLMHDGDPSTAWRTWTYFNNPNFGRLKPGAGVLIDLGAPKQLAYVNLLLETEPTEVQIMVPADDPNADQPPVDSVDQWRVVSRNDAAGREVQLEVSEQVTSRWVLIYFTKLPAIETDHYRTGIFEAQVFGR